MARISTASSTESWRDLVDRVTFPNTENGFCVLRVSAASSPSLAKRAWQCASALAAVVD